jgi:hypothetical protein
LRLPAACDLRMCYACHMQPTTNNCSTSYISRICRCSTCAVISMGSTRESAASSCGCCRTIQLHVLQEWGVHMCDACLAYACRIARIRSSIPVVR